MSEYQLTATESSVIRTEDGACIPNDPANRDYAEYQKWLAVPNTPDPYVPPPEVEPVPTNEQLVLYDHENRLRAQEGAPPLTLDGFIAKMNEPTKQNYKAPAPAKKRR
jgi:hypothetical protein